MTGTENGYPMLTVKEHRIGIPKEAEESLWAFYRVDKEPFKIEPAAQDWELAIVRSIS